MDWLSVQITRAEVEQWLMQARDYALPRLLQTVGQLILGLIAFVVLRWILKRVESSFSSKTATKVDDHFVDAARRIGSISVVAWAFWRTAHIWELPGLARFAIAAWIVTLSVPLAGLVSNLLTVVEEELVSKTENTLDDTALPLLNKASRVVIVAGGVIIALSAMDIDIMPFVAGASVLGVALGFAAKDTLSNLIAGVLLIVDRPFHVGDRIELWTTPTGTGTWGDVIEIGLRATKIRNPDNLIFVIPNNEIMKRDIVNYTASGDNIRLRIPISIAYDADPQKAKKIVRAVALEIDGVLSSPEPQVIIRNFAESAVDLQLRVWIADARQRRAIGDLITDRVKQEFDRAGVEIPYAKRDLYIRAMPAPAATAGSAGSSEQAVAPMDSPLDRHDAKTPRTKQGEADE
jgi:small-conductance mechanosensitive channel